VPCRRHDGIDADVGGVRGRVDDHRPDTAGRQHVVPRLGQAAERGLLAAYSPQYGTVARLVVEPTWTGTP
jgi:hypothetical protein